MGKSDRAFFFSVIALLLALGVTPGLWLDCTWSAALALLLWTIFNRIRSSLKDLEDNGLDKTAG
jgi:CDP-diacylglycerol--glycerol-3-phosphate 3-phosphatidyltransferase